MMTEYRPLKVVKKMSYLGGPTLKKTTILFELKIKTVGSTVPHISVSTLNEKKTEMEISGGFVGWHYMQHNSSKKAVMQFSF